MLASMRIENFAIVSLLELDFREGMTAFTGETGAGKSIMIDALMLALGGRVDASVIRPHAPMCDVTACFHFGNDSFPAEWLKAHDIPYVQDEVVLRRVLYAEGRSKSYINGTLFPQQKVKELSELLVDIHGQHQHQTLLNHQTHRNQLDQFANHQALLDEVAKHYRHCLKIAEELEALESKQTATERIALLQYQIEELAQLRLQEGELDALHEAHLHLHHAKDYIEQSERVMNLLSGDEESNITRAIHYVQQSLSSLPQGNAAIKNTIELMNNALIQCDEALSEITRFSRQIQLDPERLQQVEERMGFLHQTARKYHIEPRQLLEKLQELQSELLLLQQQDSEKDRLRLAYETAKTTYETLALQLRDSREKHAPLLAQKITQYIQQLGMPKGYIEIKITALDKMHSYGLDKVEYYVCTNPGMLPDTLSKVASGGELSRISLAIQMITAQSASTPTLLFDEVDVGIGGATAALVGQMLRKLGERLQIFCVTHQPQVAALAHHHFKVEKQMNDLETFSNVTLLSQVEKIDEVARMMGGFTITSQTRAHARELIESI